MQKWKDDFYKRQRLEKFFTFVLVRKGGKKHTLSIKEVTIILNCLEFYFDNPVVWEVFENLSKTLLKKKKTKYGVAAVWERMRWEIDIVLQREDLAHKLNNNYKAFYSRLFNFIYETEFFTKRDSIMDHILFDMLYEKDLHGQATAISYL